MLSATDSSACKAKSRGLGLLVGEPWPDPAEARRVGDGGWDSQQPGKRVIELCKRARRTRRSHEIMIPRSGGGGRNVNPD